ncbi:hypothetical protein B0I37DRAFT_410801 [Chaetomium sp. MPI-CAGE-AT-0009]|nr:hypothetical protein B0I37DRAFT_410801 [Chaetomium sp. MPI-CAGE-AT-0009]
MATEQPNFDMTREEAEELADSLARALNAVEIPCVLWGDYLLSLWGVLTVTHSLDFVIPDASLAAAKEVMMTSKQLTQPLIACPDTATCPGNSAGSSTPPPAFHLHIQGACHHLSTTTVRLFLQSETLWFLPPLSALLASPRAHPLPVIACDLSVLPPSDTIRDSNGAFVSGQTVVLVPKTEIMLEAYMRIMGRDWGTPLFYEMDVCYMSLYVERYGFVDPDLLPPPFGALYKAFTKETMPMVDVMVALRRAMGLPPVDLAA